MGNTLTRSKALDKLPAVLQSSIPDEAGARDGYTRLTAPFRKREPRPKSEPTVGGRKA